MLVLMIYILLIFLGLCLGSFVNALVWRIHKQAEIKESHTAQSPNQLEALSIVKGRSMCLHCGHDLAPKDLVPVLSWLYLRGKCRYCKKPIDDTPVAELLTALLVVVSFALWPYTTNGWSTIEIAMFAIWVLTLTGFVALIIYDAKWYLLPDRIVAPVTVLSALLVSFIAFERNDVSIVIWSVLGGLTISGIFYLLALVSKGAWIGGGDVKLGMSLGLLAGTPLLALLVVFLASLLATVYLLPSILIGDKGLKSHLPFGPFLISAAFITFFYGKDMFAWYSNLFIQ
jgi:leader peptidase (prepilin peptidase)/N-methyltransferase